MHKILKQKGGLLDAADSIGAVYGDSVKVINYSTSLSQKDTRMKDRQVNLLEQCFSIFFFILSQWFRKNFIIAFLAERLF